MTLLHLYSFRRCPYAIRARLALHVSGTSYALREIQLRDKPPSLLAASPKGSVPVLVLADGQVLDESWDIMQWALRQHDPDNWLGHNDRHLADAATLVAINDGHFKTALDRYPPRTPASRLPRCGRDIFTAVGSALAKQPRFIRRSILHRRCGCNSFRPTIRSG